MMINKNVFVLVRPTPSTFFDKFKAKTLWITTPVIVRLVSDNAYLPSEWDKEFKVIVDITRPLSIFGFNIMQVVTEDMNGLHLMLSNNIRRILEKPTRKKRIDQIDDCTMAEWESISQ